MNTKLILTAGLIGSIFSTAHAQNIPLDSAVRTGTLSNGFTYYIRHNEQPKNRVIFYLANKVGSVLEDEDQRGLAHFMEHMSFNGTKNFPKNELINYLQKAGVRFGADINAYTGFDETVYQLPLPSDNPEILKNGVEIVHDWAHGALLDSVEIDKERGVVLEEKRLGKGASERMRRSYWPIILNNSRYSQRMPIGLDTVLNNFRPQTIKRFYNDWYRPDLQALIVVGDIDVDQMEKVIKAKFADLKNPVNEKARTLYKVPLTGKNEFVAVTDPEMTATTADIIIKFPELPLHTISDYRANIVRQLFNNMMGQRCGELLRQSDPPFLSANAAVGGFLGGLDNYDINVTAKPGDLEKAVKAIWRENERVKRFGFTPTELQRAKESFLNRYKLSLTEKDKNPSENYVREYLDYFLHGTASPGIAYEFNLANKEINGITLDEINTLIKTINKQTDRDILIMAPDKEKKNLPDNQLFNNWLTIIEADNILPYKDEFSKESLLKSIPATGKIVSEKKDDHNGIITLLLSNGIRVLLKPTDFKNDQIIFSGFGPGGTSLYGDSDFQSASAANVIPSYGAGNYNTTQLGKYLTGKQLIVQPFIAERSQGVNGSTVKENLEDALQLTYAYLTAPRKDSSMFNGLMIRSKAGIANRLNDPNSVYQDTISAILGNHNLRRTGPSLAKLEQVSLDRAYSIYRERFANESGFVFVFIGSIDMPAIKPLIEKYLASLPASGKKEEAKDLHINVPTGIIKRTVYKGTEQKASVTLVFTGAFDDTMENKLVLDALKESLQIRLIENLREDEGGVYSPSTRVSTVKYPRSTYNLTITFGCAPQNVDKLINLTLGEVEKLKTTGPSQINLDKFKAENQRTFETSLKTNGFWLTYLSGQIQNREDLNQIDDYAKLLNSIPPEKVRKMANDCLTGKNYIQLVLMPEKSK
ncbi:pitrilysin family protein [Mucilaginibacter sp. SG564]|uniref:M16 family metallopeptidase n=1 Tax=Mucilaginibacter sp. SG564 TaxID=2587022 RepID=UPI001553B970|nr:M16 family metallopeptidase [Mucilaginibacter sp. SG564]NOW95068.1 zinc protease [Mucilaginibacter sp. SG564]